MWLFDDLLGKTGTTPTPQWAGQASSAAITNATPTTMPTTNVTNKSPDPIASVETSTTPQVVSQNTQATTAPTITPIADNSTIIVQNEEPKVPQASIEDLADLSPSSIALPIINEDEWKVELAIDPMANISTPQKPTSTVQVPENTSTMPINDIITHEPLTENNQIDQWINSNSADIAWIQEAPIIVSAPETSKNVAIPENEKIDQKVWNSWILSMMEESTNDVAVWDQKPSIENTTDFIRQSLTEIDTLVGTMQKNHNAKIEEADGYKQKKEEFAELEKNAKQEADSMVGEQKKAEEMRSYLQKQLDDSESDKKSSTKSSLSKTTIRRQPQKNKARATVTQ